MKRVMAFILAGGRTEGLSVFAEPRSGAAVPFAGKFRLIDFTLSNCVNSEIYNVAILAQYAPLSLATHVGRGDPWDLNRREGGLNILQPYARQEGARWYQGTADSLRQNLDVLVNSGADQVFVLSSDLIYKMDYSWMFEHHRTTGAQATLAVGNVPHGEVHRFGMARLGPDDTFASFEEKPAASDAEHAFMGVYLFETDYLARLLTESTGANLILDILAPQISQPHIRAYPFLGYWDDVGTVRDYFRAHQRLLGEDPAPDLYDPAWPILTRSEEMPPAFFDADAVIEDSLIANGAVIEGTVIRSVISPGVFVARGAMVSDSVVFNGTVVGPHAVIHRSVIDKNVWIGSRSRIGAAGSNNPITAIGKWARLPDGAEMAPGEVRAGGEPMAEAAAIGGIHS